MGHIGYTLLYDLQMWHTVLSSTWPLFQQPAPSPSRLSMSSPCLLQSQHCILRDIAAAVLTLLVGL